MTLLLSRRSGKVGDLVDLHPPELLVVVDSSSLGLTSDGIANVSGVAGASVTDALDNLNGDIDALPALLAGTGLHNSNDVLTTRIRPRLVQLSDYFVSGGNASGSIGQLGWSLLGNGTPAITRFNGNFGTSSVTNRITLQTSAAINDRSSLLLADSETRTIMRPTELNILQACVALPSLLNKRVFFGLNDNFAAPPAATLNCLGFLWDSAVNANWQIVSRELNGGVPVVTTVPPSGAPQLLTIMRLGDDVYQFYIGNTLVGTISAGVADATGMAVGFQVTTLAVASATLAIGYFGLQAVGGNALASDDFLQG